MFLQYLALDIYFNLNVAALLGHELEGEGNTIIQSGASLELKFLALDLPIGWLCLPLFPPRDLEGQLRLNRKIPMNRRS